MKLKSLLLLLVAVAYGMAVGFYLAHRPREMNGLRITVETAIIVALITLLGTLATAFAKPLLDRIWPERKKDE